ncbi:phosphatidylethanolamine N-methyltransferase [Komagataella kurtzmanii]|nr:phosphatidylethanolamine N-methyltransferase [Komagataella kurtzmanii]
MVKESKFSYNSKDEKKYSLGKTFRGDIFNVPETHDMVRSLFDPTVKKSVSDYLIVLSLFINGIVYYYSPVTWRIPVFIVLYSFWRLGYNLGIGILLYKQSKSHSMFHWLKQIQINGGWAKKFVELELSSKLNAQQLNSVPDEFKTWIVFRSLVNLILMNDFTTYMCLVFACSDGAFNQSLSLIFLRWVLGISFFIFNIIVKLNAHLIVKDYAWYWGDFFFRLHNNEELIFDGVFDLAPHPMYSIGYAGYYGCALMTKSYTVLIMSIFGHLLQFLFLNYVETPHIEKIYGDDNLSENTISVNKRDDSLFIGTGGKPLVMLTKNFNWLRTNDIFTVVLALYASIVPIFLPASYNNSIIILAIVVKIGTSFVLNSVLYLQSRFKSWTLSFIKNYGTINISILDNKELLERLSFQNWTLLQNNTLVLNYSMLFTISVREVMYNEKFWQTEWLPLRFILAALMILGQFLTVHQMIDSIGLFGWYYGDFFIGVLSSHKSEVTTLSRSGIYHFLNNPERVTSNLTVWALYLLFNNSNKIFLVIALLFTMNNLIVLNFIEKPHMVKLYGEQNVLKHTSGIEKSINSLFLPNHVQGTIVKLSGSIDKVIQDSSKVIDEFIRNKHNQKPKELSLKKRRNSFQQVIELIRGSTDDTLTINLQELNDQGQLQLLNLLRKDDTDFYNLGDPIKVEWNMEDHKGKDKAWIGLYNIFQTSETRTKTLVSSKGYWIPIHRDKYINLSDKIRNEEDCILEDELNRGVVQFSAELLPWVPGTYELRLHANEKHEVLAISKPFDIAVKKIDVPTSDDIGDERLEDFANKLYQGFVSKLFPTIESIEDESNWFLQMHIKENARQVKKLCSTLSQSCGVHLTKKAIVDEKCLKDLSFKISKLRKMLDELML